MDEEPIRSELADDPEMADLLREYLKGLTVLDQKVRRALAGGDVGALRVLGHQLKGSGAGYGLPALSEAGAALEGAADRAGRVDEGVRAAAEELLRVARRALAGR